LKETLRPLSSLIGIGILISIAQQRFLNFSRRGHREGFKHHDLLRNLEAAQMTPAMPVEIVGADIRPRLEQDEGRYRFRPSGMGQAYDGRVGDACVPQQNFLDLQRRTFSPPDLIMSFLRSTNSTGRRSRNMPRSPVWCQPKACERRVASSSL